MVRFVLIMLSFGVMGMTFYEMSGGKDFDPEALRLSRIDTQELPQPAAEPQSRLAAIDTTSDEVSRVALNLTTVEDVIRPHRATQPVTAASARERLREQAQAHLIDASADPGSNTSAIIIPSLLPGATPEGTGVTVAPVDWSTPTAAVQSQQQDVRSVSGSRVNVRGGPGTNFSVVTSLTRGEEVIVLQDPGDGWVQLRPVDGGPVGWMADFLLTGAG